MELVNSRSDRIQTNKQTNKQPMAVTLFRRTHGRAGCYATFLLGDGWVEPMGPSALGAGAAPV